MSKTKVVDADSGEVWWVGYDVSSASYFADRDNDLQRDDYFPAELPRFKDLTQALTGQLVLSEEMKRRLLAEEPISVVAAQAAMIARIDQVSAAVRDPGEQLDPELQRIIDLNKRDYPASAAEIGRPSTGNTSEHYKYRSPQRGRDTDHGLDA